jgi:3-phosphoshikimate 1-carboxyvinyltransferase
MAGIMTYQLSKPRPELKGRIRLDGSKSISNRLLMIRALCQESFPLHHLSDSKDTRTMLGMMDAFNKGESEVFDAGAAGTAFRFMTAFLAMQEGSQTLTGTERMKQRPIGILVDALRKLGAQIDYIEKDGYPPLRIHAPKNFGQQAQLSIPANTSSQYITALLLIAPTLSGGLRLKLEGTIVSRPYIDMTVGLMNTFGVPVVWDGPAIVVSPVPYQAKPFTVEADWSAASYYYSLAALSSEVDLVLEGLFPDSLQGDAVLAEMMEFFGIQTDFIQEGIHLKKIAPPRGDTFHWDFLTCPDLAQTLAVTVAGLGLKGEFTGLETLRIKETDRILALQQELAKVGASMTPMQKDGYFLISGKASVPHPPPVFDTYEDHRMAMAFAPLSVLGKIRIAEPMVVVKSYYQFYDDLASLGVEVERDL